MKTRNITLVAFALVMLALTAMACSKSGSSANVNSSPDKNGSSSSSKSSAASNRFVGTWVEEDLKSDQGSKFTEDGRVIEVSSGKQVGTYTTSGDDKAAITIAEGGGGTATLESDTRMKMVVGGETVYLRKK